MKSSTVPHKIKDLFSSSSTNVLGEVASRIRIYSRTRTEQKLDMVCRREFSSPKSAALDMHCSTVGRWSWVETNETTGFEEFTAQEEWVMDMSVNERIEVPDLSRTNTTISMNNLGTEFGFLSTPRKGAHQPASCMSSVSMQGTSPKECHSVIKYLRSDSGDPHRSTYALENLLQSLSAHRDLQAENDPDMFVRSSLSSETSADYDKLSCAFSSPQFDHGRRNLRNLRMNTTDDDISVLDLPFPVQLLCKSAPNTDIDDANDKPTNQIGFGLRNRGEQRKKQSSLSLPASLFDSEFCQTLESQLLAAYTLTDPPSAPSSSRSSFSLLSTSQPPILVTSPNLPVNTQQSSHTSYTPYLRGGGNDKDSNSTPGMNSRIPGMDWFLFGGRGHPPTHENLHKMVLAREKASRKVSGTGNTEKAAAKEKDKEVLREKRERKKENERVPLRGIFASFLFGTGRKQEMEMGSVKKKPTGLR